MNKKKLFSGFLLVTFIALCGFAAIKSRDILDYIALKGYEPPARISRLADVTTMNESTRRVFYINRPELDDKAAFKERCEVAEQSIVLGCYVSHRGIFLLDVNDPRLSGVIEVTAAHETLHAQYDRLSNYERKRVDGLTADFFATLQNDRIKKTIEQYRAKDPKVVPNELHSILGTEVRDLPPELEQHYSRYFTDRQKIVAFSEQYEQTFISLKTQVSDYDARLEQLKGQIEANKSQISSLNTAISDQRQRLDELFQDKQIEDYNAAVPGFNSLVTQYNSLIGQTRRLIAEFNDIFDKRNAVATTEQELFQAINSNSLPPEETQ